LGTPQALGRAVLAYAEAGTNLLILILADEGPQLVDDLRLLGNAVLPARRRNATSD
jgi:hypothetical protein